jgi:hypothetical protein
VRRAWKASSRCSLCQDAIRSADRSPASTLACTAQPGSPTCAQSAKRQAAARSSTSEKARDIPSSEPATATPRSPGVSMTTAPDGSTTSSRWVVVCRPLSSTDRTAPTSITAPPASAFTTVDLPVPEAPSSTSVVPGRLYGASAATSPSAARTVRTSTPGACGAARAPPARVGVQVGLGEHDDRVAPLSQASRSSRSTRRTGSRAGQRRADQHDVDVGGQRLGAALAGGGAAHEQGGAGQHGVHRVVGDGQPVADGGGMGEAEQRGDRAGRRRGGRRTRCGRTRVNAGGAGAVRGRREVCQGWRAGASTQGALSRERGTAARVRQAGRAAGEVRSAGPSWEHLLRGLSARQPCVCVSATVWPMAARSVDRD